MSEKKNTGIKISVSEEIVKQLFFIITNAGEDDVVTFDLGMFVLTEYAPEPIKLFYIKGIVTGGLYAFDAYAEPVCVPRHKNNEEGVGDEYGEFDCFVLRPLEGAKAHLRKFYSLKEETSKEQSSVFILDEKGEKEFFLRGYGQKGTWCHFAQAYLHPRYIMISGERLTIKSFRDDFLKFIKFLEVGVEALYAQHAKNPPDTTMFLRCIARKETIGNGDDDKENNDTDESSEESEWLSSQAIYKEEEEGMKQYLKQSITVIKNFDVSFDDIGGQEKAKFELRGLSYAINHPDIYEKYGIRLPKGILLHGPSGTGKTLAVKALAHETSATLFHIQASDINSKWFGESERFMRLAFQIASENKPSILLFDEIDALGGSREGIIHEASRRVLLTMCEQMDGFRPAAGVIVIGVTNRFEDVDPALLRPGRFDKIIEVGYPTRDGRKEIFLIHIRRAERGKKIAERIFADIEWDHVLNQTSGTMTGADIENIIQSAIERKVRAEIATGIKSIPVTTDDLIFEIKEHQAVREISKRLGFL